MKYPLKWNVPNNGMLLQKGMSLKMECHLTWIVTQTG